MRRETRRRSSELKFPIHFSLLAPWIDYIRGPRPQLSSPQLNHPHTHVQHKSTRSHNPTPTIKQYHLFVLLHKHLPLQTTTPLSLNHYTKPQHHPVMSSSGQANQPTMDNNSVQPANTEEQRIQDDATMRALAEDLRNFQKLEELKFKIMPRWRKLERFMIPYGHYVRTEGNPSREVLAEKIRRHMRP